MTAGAGEVTVHPQALLAFVTRVIAAMGTPPGAARAVAEHLTGANLAGHDSHGIIRLRQYLDHVRQGKVVPGASPSVVRETSATALIEGNRAWGQPVALRAVEIASEKARRAGAAAVAARNAYHVGRIGAYALLAAGEGLIASIHCSVAGAARVAPWGGTEARLATNPIAIAVPAKPHPIVVDITTSVVAEGKVRLARDTGKSIPEGWVLDRDGNPSADPAALYAGGTLLPLGGREGHKGYALGLAVDLLGGIVAGAGAGFLASPASPPGTFANNFLVQALDPGAFGPRDEFERGVRDYLAYVKSSRPRPGVPEVLLPGEPEVRAEEARRQDGIRIAHPVWQDALAVARELGVAADGLPAAEP